MQTSINRRQLAAGDPKRGDLRQNGLEQLLSESDKPISHRFYYQMYLIRKVEEALLRDRGEQGRATIMRSSRRQEAVDVGIINALDARRDSVFSEYRPYGQFITCTDDVAGLLAGMKGGVWPGCCGNGGSQPRHEFRMNGNGSRGTIMREAVRAAQMAKRDNTGAISVVFLNEESLATEPVREGIDRASSWCLPLLLVLGNSDAAHSSVRWVRPGEDVARSADEREVTSLLISTEDVFKVYAFARAAVAYVRSNPEPFFLRLQRDSPDARTAETGNGINGCGSQGKKVDPLYRMGRQLSPNSRRAIEFFVEGRIEETLRAGRSA